MNLSPEGPKVEKPRAAALGEDSFMYRSLKGCKRSSKMHRKDNTHETMQLWHEALEAIAKITRERIR